jgi:hypothetical protein
MLDHWRTHIQPGVSSTDAASVQKGEEVAEAAPHVQYGSAVELAQGEQRFEALLLRGAIAEAEPAMVVAIAADFLGVPADRFIFRRRAAHRHG